MAEEVELADLTDGHLERRREKNRHQHRSLSIPNSGILLGINNLFC